MKSIEKIQFIEKILFDSLDKKANKNGYKDWKDMKLKLNIQRWQSAFVEETIRLALNKLDSVNKEKL